MRRSDDLTNVQRSDLCRRHLEGAESWLRRLVHHELSKAFGKDYLERTPGVRRRISEDVAAKRRTTAVERDVDATTFGQLIDIATNEEVFTCYTGTGLRYAYPLGVKEARRYLTILLEIRNSLAHGNVCSERDLERAVCYSNDLADGLKLHFGNIGMAREYDVPMIVRYADSLGNSSTLEGVSTDISTRIIDWRAKGVGDLRSGDVLVAEVEVDPSYKSSGYSVVWNLFGEYGGAGSVAQIRIHPRHVGEQLELRFTVKTERDWHRYHGMDDSLCLVFRVLPPL